MSGNESAYAPGQHLLIDFWGARQPASLAETENLLLAAAAACGAQVLDVRLHGFGDQGGITGVAILVESHISLHTWPEHDYIALDIFLCGNRDPQPALILLEDKLKPSRSRTSNHPRGTPYPAP